MIKTAIEDGFNTYGGDLYYLTFASLYLAFLSALVTFPLNLMLFQSRWTRPEILTEAWMTLIPPRQLAFGSVFWGVTIGFMIPAGFLAVALPTATLVLRRNEEALLFVGACSAGVVCAALIAVWSWFRVRHLKFLLFLRVPVMMTLLTLWSILALIGPVIIVDRLYLYTYREELAFAFVFIWLIWLTARALNWACELAPTRMFASIFPEALQQRHFVDASLALMRDPDAKSMARRGLRDLVAMPWKRTIIVLATIATISGCVLLLPDVRAFNTVLTVYYFCGAAALAASVIMLLEFRQGRPPVLVSGLVYGSIARRLFPLSICFLLLFCVPSTLGIVRMHAKTEEILIATVATGLLPMAFMYLLVMPAVAWCLASRFPRTMLLQFGVLSMILALLCLPYRIVNDWFWIEVERDRIVALVILYFALISPPMSRAFQSLHRKYLSQLPVGESTR